MLFTKAAKHERRFRSGDYRPFGHTKTSHIFHVVLSVLTGSTPDISPLLSFEWWEPVFYKLDDFGFPSKSR
jgi:hypothetical protein